MHYKFFLNIFTLTTWTQDVNWTYITLHKKKWSFPLTISLVNVTSFLRVCSHTEEILNGKLHFLWSVRCLGDIHEVFWRSYVQFTSLSKGKRLVEILFISFTKKKCVPNWNQGPNQEFWSKQKLQFLSKKHMFPSRHTTSFQHL